MIICLILISLISFTYTQSPIELAKSFNSLEGIQIYLFEDNTKFIYLSINNSFQLDLNASLIVYLDIKESDINLIGKWFAIGFGTTHMPDSDIILCALTYDKKASCGDYIAKGWDIVEKDTQHTVLISYKLVSLDNSYSPYKTCIIFEFNNNQVTRLENIFNGKKSVISAFGKLDLNNKPISHLSNDVSIVQSTTDGAHFNQIKNQTSTTSNTNNKKGTSLISVLYKKTTTNSSNICINLIFGIALALILIN